MTDDEGCLVEQTVGVVAWCFQRYRSIPRPILALPPRRLYRVFVHGSGFTLSLGDGQKTARGFYITWTASALSRGSAEAIALEEVRRDWKGSSGLSIRTGVDLPALVVEESETLEIRFRLRRRTGYCFYYGDDDDPTTG